jgi:tetratricopeptide (TPR) repeat protein
LLAAYEAYLAHPDAADASDRDAVRYHLAQLLAETGDVEAALAHLIALTESATSPELAAWAGALLVDELVLQWSVVDVEARLQGARRLKEQLTRLQSLPLWRHEAARPLRELAPRLDAGIRWREGVIHRDRGRNARRPDERSAAFLACADAFLALHADYGANHDKADTLLWNAATCLNAGLQPMAAVAQFERLLELYPDSYHARESTIYVAGILTVQARYARAVEWYERFAARFPKDSDAPTALAIAIELRAALGPKDALEADLSAYESLYKRKDPKRAARILWSGYALLATDDRSRRAYAERYLKIYGHRGGRGREVIAEVALADAIRSQTCPLKQTESGLCVAAASGKEVSLRFTDSPVVGRHQLPTRELHRRRNADAEASLRGFRRALIILENTRIDVPPDDTRQLRDLAYASARAWLALADALFETLLDGSNPALASGPPPKKPDPRSSPWSSYSRPLRGHEAASIAVEARLSALAGVRGPLAEVIDRLERAYASLEEHHVGTPSAAIASARRGQLSEWLMDHVLLGETSPSRPCESTGHRSRRCTTTKERYDALRGASRDAYARCVAQMRHGAVADETAELCLRKLAILDPTNPAHLPEMFGTSGPYDAEEPAALADRAGVVTDYETACSATEHATATADASDPGTAG